MLSELKHRETIAILHAENADSSRFLKYDQLETLALDCDGEEQYDYRGQTVVVRGIPEDCRVFLDGQQVCEIVYGSVYNLNKALADRLLDPLYDGQQYGLSRREAEMGIVE